MLTLFCSIYRYLIFHEFVTYLQLKILCSMFIAIIHVCCMAVIHVGVFIIFYPRFMLGLAAVPSIVQFFGFLFLPESPRWLVAHGKIKDAEVVLVNIRGSNNVKEELEEVKLSVEEDRREKELSGGSVVYFNLGAFGVIYSIFHAKLCCACY